MTKVPQFELAVVGGGHAGAEAALAAARLGRRTLLVTFSAGLIGEMSCNPAIGGLGKGQLVKEIDALFGEMGRAIDDTGIQFRTLNASRGPAVRSSRAQADREAYRRRMSQAVMAQANLSFIEGEVEAVETSGYRVAAVVLRGGERIPVRAAVLTTGTFLRGLMHTGPEQFKGGRIGEPAADGLSASLQALGLELGRLKTGTPARLDCRTIDYSKLVKQPGDEPIRPFSFRTGSISRPQVPCWLTATSERTHQIIAANVKRSPLFNGQIQGTGPRYCPSIEDKVFRFPDRTSHHIFLEPEGRETCLVYPNGISTSLPRDVQEAFIRTIPGLEQVTIQRFGYAVEYDFVDPRQLDLSLQVKDIQGLFLAGQINGTSGYEEAGAQGLLAGINAAQFLRDGEPVVLGRDQAYIGVMIDDLTAAGVLEPYRMFTSRAEYRLHLREDNADVRLTPIARSLGLAGDSDWAHFAARQERIGREKDRLERTTVRPLPEISSWLAALGSAAIYDAVPLACLLRRPEVSYEALAAAFSPSADLTAADRERVETEIKFAGYLRRQEEDIARLRRMDDFEIPKDFSYDTVKGLSIEVRQRLSQARPCTLGQASRISGVTPAAVSLVAIYVRRAEQSAVKPRCGSRQEVEG